METPQCEREDSSFPVSAEERWCEKFHREGTDDSSWSSVSSDTKDALLAEIPTSKRTGTSIFTWSNESWQKKQSQARHHPSLRSRWTAQIADSGLDDLQSLLGLAAFADLDEQSPQPWRMPRLLGFRRLPVDRMPPNMSNDANEETMSTGSTGSNSNNHRMGPAALALQYDISQGKYSL